MAASTTPPKPTTTTPIPGAIAFNTTGYPAPPPPPDRPAIVAVPSHPALEFSIADLHLLGNVTDIRHLVFEMIFIKPKTAQVKEFKLEIFSPERKQLYLTNLASEGCIHHSCHTIHTFSLNTNDARKAEHLFVPGNRFIVHATLLQEVEEGKLQVAVRKFC